MKTPVTHTFTYPVEFSEILEHKAHSGQQVEILRQLTQDEADQGEGMERMFRILAADGWEGEAFESELHPQSGLPA